MTSSTTKSSRASTDAARHGDTMPASSLVHRKAFRSGPAIGVFLIVALGGLAADLVSKHQVFTSLTAGRPELASEIQAVRSELARRTGAEPSSKDILHALRIQGPLVLGAELTLSTNPGVVFGLPVPRPIVVVATVVVTAVVLAIFVTSPAGHYGLHLAMGCILAGALGNLYDRMLAVVELPGIEPIRYQVRDFLDFSAWGYPWVFNVADALLVIGVGVILGHSLIHCRSPKSCQN